MTKKKDPKDLKKNNGKSKHNGKKKDNEIPEYVGVEQTTEQVVDTTTGEVIEIIPETENLPAKRNPFVKENTTITYNFTEDEISEKSRQLARACTEKRTVETERL